MMAKPMIRITSFILLLFFLISSCKSERQKMDDKVCSHLKEYYKNNRYSKYSDFDLTKITYDTIGDGCWAYELARLMLNTPGIITDSILYGELESTSQLIDTFDHRLRVIVNVFGGHKNGTNNQWKYYPDPSYTIGIIGDSLTTVNESRLCILLNMCDSNEMRIIDIANVADLGKRSFLRDSVLRKQVDLGWYVRDKKDIVYSKNMPFIDGKNIIDTSLSLQFVGYRLNDVIDTIHDINLYKEYEFKNYCLYKVRKPFAINDNIHFFELEIFTLEGRIAMIKAICTDDITAFLKRLFQIKYGEESYGHIDSYFFETVYGTRQSVWNFGTNCILLNDNREDVGKWDYPCGSNQKKWFHFYDHFHNVTIIYCDKQMYRRLRIADEEMRIYIEELKRIEHNRRIEVQRHQDSIRKAMEDNLLKRNSDQI
jgi:hypothetical protein